MPDDAALPEAPHEFFEKKSRAAVLKHGILKRHIVPFVSKTGSMSRSNRVVVIYGYARLGRYANSAPGSSWRAWSGTVEDHLDKGSAARVRVLYYEF